jgi:hypothetical protein
MKKKNILAPNLPNSNNDLEDLPEDYKLISKSNGFFPDKKCFAKSFILFLIL